MGHDQVRRLTAQLEGDFVIFRIGMRINSLWRVRGWLPVFRAMIPMTRELMQHPEIGFLGMDVHFGLRNIWYLQYWRDYDHLIAYAHDPERHHLPAWRAFNREIRRSGVVGIWHETYRVRAGEYETVYVNTPPIGLGAVATLVPASGSRQSSRGRLGLSDGADAPVDVDGVDRAPPIAAMPMTST